MPGRDELPDTLKRSPKKAQRTFIKTHDSAVEQYGEGERAHRTALAAVAHSFEKVGDRWEARAEKGRNETKKHLLELARRLDVPGRSTMTKPELVEAIRKANDRETRKARE
ncbi:MAG TPA: ChaB family protein [Actinoplanes sp.]|nr:ChaB family protein [Actinoplanes sp.]